MIEMTMNETVEPTADAEIGTEPAHGSAEPAAPSPYATLAASLLDPATGTPSVERLVEAYLQLERRAGELLPRPSGPDDEAARERLLEALGRPASPDGYELQATDERLPLDPELNARLHAAGFTSSQAQLVYDLAAEHMTRLADDVVAEAVALHEQRRLVERFGGERGWAEVARQLKAWGGSHLEPATFDALARSHDGILAMHQMMRASEPSVLDGGAAAAELDESALAEMVRDPRYWRDRDPDFVAQVSAGFRKFYGG
jgi:hypothetical protein